MSRAERARAQARVLLIYSRVGGGHLSAARALATELEATGRAETRLLDIYVEAGRFPVTLFPRAYAELARHYPRVWSLIYQTGRLHLQPRAVLKPFLQSGLQRVLERERPDVIISVLPAVNGLIANESRACGTRFEVVLTDWHSVHRFWVADGVDHYTAPTESARQDCVRYGAASECVEVVGIPVDRAFATPVLNARSTLAALSLDWRTFTVLAMVGAEGSPGALRNLAYLMQMNSSGQLIVVCGNNQRLRRQLERRPHSMPTRALGFVDNIAELMCAADLLITKAGGLTLAEAFCSGTPVVVHDVLPGQEAGNLEFALHHGAAVYARNRARLAHIIAELYADAPMRERLVRRGQQLARPHAAAQIAQNLLARLDA
jgi:UDP-N-acetylglucosamine:LPS N-acetylglucosamine transferase